MSEKKLIVFVYLPGETVAVPAGIFTHDSRLSLGSFSYGLRYLERSNCIAVDPVALPLGRAPREVMINVFKGEFIIATRAIMSKSLTQPDGGEGCSVSARGTGNGCSEGGRFSTER